ncbi:DUF4180 domain-containing protein [Paenibacillus tianjinensis]|uniref:DUF4180 domain-containing protein n=1 Tax=Paenibacillus tianjinensis TaxID=2810347 RepID=A0ABX7L4F5_9BACL|nr:DUF4180 domain-containing protein [Paenibacillus tianjinensis]QSF42792.1 DUF4180 domain-containing protein [Paenibacillus tianjinensis]
MSINNAILGLLSSRPLSGYDLKKLIQESTFMYWSGNNNQIYKALVELLNEGYVTNEVKHQESSPSKKIYTITAAGQQELRRWVLSSPEQPEVRKTFLIQLAWCNGLETDEILRLLDGYEQEIRSLIQLEQGKAAKGGVAPDRSPREALIWRMIDANILSTYTSELQWIREVREAIIHEEEADVMNIQVITKEDEQYIAFRSSDLMLSTEQDILDLVGVCMEHNIYKVLLHEEVLSDDFYNLRTGLAGTALQKFINYRITAAAIINRDQAGKGRFKELLAELSQGNTFRVFALEADAEAWLLQV